MFKKIYEKTKLFELTTLKHILKMLVKIYLNMSILHNNEVFQCFVKSAPFLYDIINL